MTTKRRKNEKADRTPLFSVTAKDLVFQSFTVGGAGGQGRDHVNTGVRYTHPASGATGESREFREQRRNKQAALKKLSEHPLFVWWVHEKVREINHEQTIAQKVDESLANPRNLMVEYRDKSGKWYNIEIEDPHA